MVCVLWWCAVVQQKKKPLDTTHKNHIRMNLLLFFGLFAFFALLSFPASSFLYF